MTMSITIASGTARTPVVVVDPKAPAGTVRVELHDAVPDPVVLPTDWRTIPSIGLSAEPAEFDRWHTAVPGAEWARAFYKPGAGIPSFRHPDMKRIHTAGMTVHASAKDPATAAQLVDEYDSIPAGARYKRTFHHEPIADGLDPAVYAAQYKLMRQVADDHPRRADITLVSCLELYAARFKSPKLDWRRYAVPEHADVLGWDCYWGEDLAYEDPYSLLGVPSHSAAEFGMPWEITELGASTTRPDRGRWLTDVVDAAMFTGCEAVGLWCTKRTFKGKPLDYRPVDEPTLTAFRALTALNAKRHRTL